MEFSLPIEIELLKKTVRRFVEQEVCPHEEQVERDDLIPEEVGRKLIGREVELGFHAIDIPTEYGGAGLGHVARCAVREELSRTSLALEFYLSLSPPLLLLEGNDFQKEHYLKPGIQGKTVPAFAMTEPGAGSDAGAIATKVERRGDTFVINGTKHFISFADIAEYAIVFAANDRSKGPHGGITCILVEKGTPGYNILRMQSCMGERGVHKCEIHFDECVVDANQILGEVGWGFKIARMYLTANRLFIAVSCVGRIEHIIEMAVRQAKQRETFGKPLAARQAVQWMIVDSAIEHRAARWLVYEAGWRADQHADIRLEASIAKVFASEALGRAVDRGIQIHGGMGYTREMTLEREYRDARLLRIIEGASEVLRGMVARRILGEASAL